MNYYECLDKFCIIGAGAAGLAAGKSLKEKGIPFDVIEARPDVGGLWQYGTNSPIYKNTHLISPKQVQAFSDFPMAEDFPDFPNHQLVWQYLQDYARHFNLYEHIEFNIGVKNLERVDTFWELTLSNGETRTYRGVIIASGCQNQPKYPNFPGHFTGKILPAKDYNTPEELSNSRVLVVGAGQSAMDILVDSAINAKKTFHSTRSGFLCFPKYFWGIPTELLFHKYIPLLKWFPIKTILKMIGRLEQFSLFLQGVNFKKLKIPVINFNESALPTIGQNIYHYYVHGDILCKPNIRELKDNRVIFIDGTEEEIDMIIYATGYKVSFPFVRKELINWSEDFPIPELYLHIFHPKYDNIFFIGLAHPMGTHWTLFERQSQLVVKYIKSQEEDLTIYQKFNHVKANSCFQNISYSLASYNNKDRANLVDKMIYLKTITQVEKKFFSAVSKNPRLTYSLRTNQTRFSQLLKSLRNYLSLGKNRIRPEI